MIKPSEIDPNKTTINHENLAGLELQFDAAIADARTTGKWPAIVGDARDGCSTDEVECVAERYRAEGWKVVTGQRTERALIDHPNRVRQ